MAKFLQLDRDGVFYAGQVVTGRIVVDQLLPDDLKEVMVKLQGNGETGWTEHESVYDSEAKKHVTRPVHYTQKEEYVYLRQTLWSNAPGIPLQRGQSLPFQFPLPPDLPPTFKGSHGFIAYSVTVKLKRPPMRLDKEETLNFTVIPLCSMAHLRNMMEPVIMKKEKQLGMLVWKQGYIGATVTLPKQVYILGDSVSVCGQITNHSSVSIRKTKASLHQTITYFCSGKKKIEKSVVSKVKQGVVAPGTIFHWTDISLPIPKSMPPSDFGPRCRLFQAEHKFQFVVDPSGMHFDLELETALKLGSVWGHPPAGDPYIAMPPISMGIPVHGPMSMRGPLPMAPPGGVHGSIPMPSAPPAAPLYPPVPFDAPPTYDEACGPHNLGVEIGQEAGEDDIARSFEKVGLH